VPTRGRSRNSSGAPVSRLTSFPVSRRLSNSPPGTRRTCGSSRPLIRAGSTDWRGQIRSRPTGRSSPPSPPSDFVSSRANCLATRPCRDCVVTRTLMRSSSRSPILGGSGMWTRSPRPSRTSRTPRYEARSKSRWPSWPPPGRHLRSDREPTSPVRASSCSRWASTARASSTSRAISISWSSTTPTPRSHRSRPIRQPRSTPALPRASPSSFRSARWMGMSIGSTTGCAPTRLRPRRPSRFRAPSSITRASGRTGSAPR
jgi:hypothetical protein